MFPDFAHATPIGVHVIYIDCSLYSTYPTHGFFHDRLKCGWGSKEPKQHSFSHVNPILGDNPTILFTSFFHHNVEEPSLNIKGRYVFGCTDDIQGVLSVL